MEIFCLLFRRRNNQQNDYHTWTNSSQKKQMHWQIVIFRQNEYFFDLYIFQQINHQFNFKPVRNYNLIVDQKTFKLAKTLNYIIIFAAKIHMSSLKPLSSDILSIVMSYLKVTEILEFSATCKDHQNNYFLKIIKTQKTYLIEDQENANILYMQASLRKMIEFSGNIYNLQLVKFIAKTKDQGWVKDCQSGSWIEAEFSCPNSQQDTISSGELYQNLKREPLIYNYQVREFQRKSKVLCSSMLPGNSTDVNVYARSNGDGWKISCQQMQILSVFSKGIRLTPKHLQTFVMRKRMNKKLKLDCFQNRRSKYLIL